MAEISFQYEAPDVYIEFSDISYEKFINPVKIRCGCTISHVLTKIFLQGLCLLVYHLLRLFCMYYNINKCNILISINI